jgi:hypothetical protein
VIQNIILELLAQKILNFSWKITGTESNLKGTESCTELFCPLGRSAEVPVKKVMETVGPVLKNCEGAG